jgi:hypothetical protein
MERSFKKKRFKDKQLSDGRGAVGALETRMRRKSAALRAKGVEPKGVAPGYLEEEWGGGFQSYQDAQREVQAGLRRDAAIERKTKIADIKAVLAGRMSKNAFTKKHRTKFSEHPLTKKIVAAREKAKARRLAESMQLDEAGYKKLMRMKAAAYKAGMKARGDSGTGEATKKYAKLMRRAADQETRQDAKMALRGQASQKAVERGGSIIGKRGVPTQQGMKLADERSRAIKRFKSAGSISRHMQTGSFDGKMDKEGVAQKRQRQQAQAKFNKQARSGDFGPVDYKARSAGMRAQLNYEKKYGRLKGK